MPYFSGKFLGVNYRENSNRIMTGPQKGQSEVWRTKRSDLSGSMVAR